MPDGMKIDDRKVEATRQMRAPKDKEGLPSFQGMVNYLKRYSVQLMRLSEPLKLLLREDAFDAIKEKLLPILQYSRISTLSLNMLFRRMPR